MTLASLRKSRMWCSTGRLPRIKLSRLQLACETARSMLLNYQTSDYCCLSVSDRSEDKRSLYRSCVVVESPAASCEVKWCVSVPLLSLSGCSSVAIARLAVGLETLKDRQGGAIVDPCIDLLRVQAMIEEMGITLTPGAQNLMELVQCQQQYKSDMLSGFIPLLMGGGAFSGLSTGGRASTSARAESGLDPLSVSEQNLSSSNQKQIPGVMSSLQSSNTCPISPELLPMLLNVCGQVTQLRLEEATRKRNGEREGHMCCGGFEQVLDKIVEKRIEEMEKRLKDHMDVHLDALQQRLEITLQQALSHTH
ncbi:ATPase PAAT-like [Xyrauchen texanus]|uniref:ATPase PAAT-like n=1 Tax=Xyrauchen texanus TaxID=154827 RepID=UPI00224251C4|nr:ATPase PAAT-like [Xyrauchen texanus]